MQPFHQGLVVIFSFAACMCLIAAGASWMRGGRYVHEEHGQTGEPAPAEAPVAATAGAASADGRGGHTVRVNRPEG